MKIVIMLLIICSGLATGVLLRRKRMRHLQTVITVLIWSLLFLLGVETGGNSEVVRAFTSLGAEAFVITIAGMAGSILLSWMLWRWVSMNKRKGEG